MEEFKGTKGEWVMDKIGDHETIFIESASGYVGTVFVTQKNPQANAQLISAAPDMLEALQNTLNALTSFIGDEKMADEWAEVKQAKKAIKKALGE